MSRLRSSTATARRQGSLLARLGFVAIAVHLGACHTMPSDYASRPIEEKVALYEEHFRGWPLPWDGAPNLISWHGWEAAELMVKYVSGQSTGLSVTTADQVLHLVQTRGCALKGTRAHEAMKEFLASERGNPTEKVLVQATLKAVENDVWVPTGADALTGGPCEGHPPRPARFDYRPQ